MQTINEGVSVFGAKADLHWSARNFAFLSRRLVITRLSRE